MWYIMQSIQSKYSLSERLIRTIAAIRSFPHDNVEDLIRKVSAFPSFSVTLWVISLSVISDIDTIIPSMPKGADVNRMHGTLKPLHCACMVADADCVELLLEKGAEVCCGWLLHTQPQDFRLISYLESWTLLMILWVSHHTEHNEQECFDMWHWIVGCQKHWSKSCVVRKSSMELK